MLGDAAEAWVSAELLGLLSRGHGALRYRTGMQNVAVSRVFEHGFKASLNGFVVDMTSLKGFVADMRLV